MKSLTVYINESNESEILKNFDKSTPNAKDLGKDGIYEKIEFLNRQDLDESDLENNKFVDILFDDIEAARQCYVKFLYNKINEYYDKSIDDYIELYRKQAERKWKQPSKIEKYIEDKKASLLSRKYDIINLYPKFTINLFPESMNDSYTVISGKTLSKDKIDKLYGVCSESEYFNKLKGWSIYGLFNFDTENKPNFNISFIEIQPLFDDSTQKKYDTAKKKFNKGVKDFN